MIELSGAVLEHANRGLRLQLLLRAALVVFLLLTVILIPPVQGATAYYVTVAAYATCAATFAGWAWKGGPSVSRWGWLGLFVDLAVLATLTLIAGIEAQQSWTVRRAGHRVLPAARAGRDTTAPRHLRRGGHPDHGRVSHRQPGHASGERRAVAVDRAADVHARQRWRRSGRTVAHPALPGAHDRWAAAGPHDPARRPRAPGGAGAPRPLRAAARRGAAVRAGGPARSGRRARRRWC